MRQLHCGRYRLSLERPLVMGIVNVTPDSFSDGGAYLPAAAAVEHGLRLKEEGADLLDVGGESSRPGAAAVPLDEELRRVVPVIEGLRGAGVPVSIDTWKPEVMRAALAAGASLINDIRALCAPGAVEVAAGSDAGVCLMHMQGDPSNMQDNPAYGDVVREVLEFLAGRIERLEAAGVPRCRMLIDPGFGFGKTLEHNRALLRNLDAFGELGVPVLVGLSRKSMLGGLTGRSIAERLPASLTAALLAVQRGAAVVRVHDVAATRDALSVLEAVENSS